MSMFRGRKRWIPGAVLAVAFSLTACSGTDVSSGSVAPGGPQATTASTPGTNTGPGTSGAGGRTGRITPQTTSETVEPVADTQPPPPHPVAMLYAFTSEVETSCGAPTTVGHFALSMEEGARLTMTLDGQPVTIPSGTDVDGELAVVCDGKTHPLILTITGDTEQVEITHQLPTRRVDELPEELPSIANYEISDQTAPCPTDSQSTVKYETTAAELFESATDADPTRVARPVGSGEFVQPTSCDDPVRVLTLIVSGRNAEIQSNITLIRVPA